MEGGYGGWLHETSQGWWCSQPVMAKVNLPNGAER
jgi:hypothetical protein